MALTKTVNYTQEVPQSLGFSSEITGTAGTVTARLTYNNKMGTLNTTYTTVSSYIYGCENIGSGPGNVWEIIGTEVEVNAALDGLTWIPKTYNDAAKEQDPHLEHREVTDHEGEVLVQIEDRYGLFSASGIAIGQPYFIKTGSDSVEYVCTKIETTLSDTRVYGVYADSYQIQKDLGTNLHKLLDPLNPYPSTLVNSDGTVEIDNIVDYAIVNPHGDSDITVEILDDDVAHDSGTVSLVGAFFVPEPYWVTDPDLSIIGIDGECSLAAFMGEVAQANNDLIAVQLLMKRQQNDPGFDGDVVINKPSYIEDNSYGRMTMSRVGNRQSENFEDGIVRWEFYGTPDDCNKALKSLFLFSNNGTDLFIEARIVNGRSRIYKHRGYN